MKIIIENFGEGYKLKSRFINEAYKFARDIHEFIELVYIEEGSLRLTVDGESRDIESGSFIVITPFRQHSYYASEKCKMWMALFSSDFVADIINETELLYHRSESYFKPSEELEVYARSRMILYDSYNVTDKAEIRYFKALFHAVFEEYIQKVEKLSEYVVDNALVSVLLYVKEHFKENIDRKSIANALGYHPVYISQCINSIPNLNLRKLLNSTRVEYAKSLLVKTDMKMIDVALECGFSGERSFYRAFGEIIKMTPGDYRSRYKI